MSQNLKMRVLTALVGVPVILFLLFGMGLEGVALFSWVVSIGMLYEFCKMFFRLPDARQKTWLALASATFIHAFNYVFYSGLSATLIGLGPVLLFFMVFLFWVPRVIKLGLNGGDIHSESGVKLLRRHVEELMALCFGMVYCVWFPLLMVSIREFSYGMHWLVFTLLIIWSSDTGAYFAGRFFGKKLLFESVSPKKTWAGVVGGSLVAILVAGGYALILIPQVGALTLLAMILLTSWAGVLGDLAESLLKRAADCKDSGSILPGHGGFLDRFDGVAFALPVMYGFLRILY